MRTHAKIPCLLYATFFKNNTLPLKHLLLGSIFYSYHCATCNPKRYLNNNKKRFYHLKHLSPSYPIFILWQRGGSCKGVEVAQEGSVINEATQFSCPVILLSCDTFIHTLTGLLFCCLLYVLRGSQLVSYGGSLCGLVRYAHKTISLESLPPGIPMRDPYEFIKYL